MMMMRSLGMALVAFMLTLDGAMAQEDYGGEGSYMTLAGLGAVDLGDDSKDEDSGGLGFRIGTFVSPNLALELHYDWVDSVAHVAGWDARVHLLTGRFQPFASVGVGVLMVSGEKVTGAWRGGGGAELFLSDSWKLTVDAAYVHGFQQDTEVRHLIIGLGVGYHFY